ncbi:hypothetical protein M413DRAFT_15625 [Hebeloma cylindrosporum]|uniref:MARVEL domain-containing protein n=1 Tax=Hebeloma cylindrosporum TaxID=76867 RepID=A0A0C3CM27_HEBCY|nr:hypothetical protein M413DRAFT_15625 [Hebeloma cylindrosporum h7]
MNRIVRLGWPIAFGALIVFSIIEMSIAAWITAKYNAHHNFPTSGTRARVRYAIFVSVWTIIFGTLYLIGFLTAPTSIFSSVVSHFFFLFITWILWMAAAAVITQTLGGALNCHVQTYFIYCGHLNALSGFAWLIFVLISFMLLFVIIRGVVSKREGETLTGGVVEA